MSTRESNNYIIEQWFSSPVYSGNAKQWSDKLLKPALKHLHKNKKKKDNIYFG